MKQALAADEEYSKETIEGTRLEQTSPNTKSRPRSREIAV